MRYMVDVVSWIVLAQLCFMLEFCSQWSAVADIFYHNKSAVSIETLELYQSDTSKAVKM